MTSVRIVRHSRTNTQLPRALEQKTDMEHVSSLSGLLQSRKRKKTSYYMNKGQWRDLKSFEIQ